MRNYPTIIILVLASIAAVILIIFRFLLYAGLAFFALSLFLGDMALETVRPQVCDFAAVNRHEDSAYITLYLFVVVAILDTVQLASNIEKHRKRQILVVLMFIFSSLATFHLGRTGHQGAMLVYEQGLAVKTSQGCGKN